MRKLLLAAALAALAVASTAPAAGERAIESGRIAVGRGVHGVTLGMTRAEVVARLGRPLYANPNGYMQYSRRNLFDVYTRFGRPRRVDVIGAAGTGFCLPHGICTLERGSLARFLRAYGRRVQVELTAEDPSESDYVIRARFRGKVTNTAFSHAPRAIGQVFVAFASPGEPAFADPPLGARRTSLQIDDTLAAGLRTAFCRDVAGSEACADPLFRGPLQGRACLAVEPGGQTMCATYRACAFHYGSTDWARAGFWLAGTGAEGTTTWFRRKTNGRWRAYRELVAGRRLAAALRC